MSAWNINMLSIFYLKIKYVWTIVNNPVSVRELIFCNNIISGMQLINNTKIKKLSELTLRMRSQDGVYNVVSKCSH